MPRQRMLPATEWSLDYEKITPAELRQLIHDRVGAALSAKETRTIQNCRRYQLINRLRKLDRKDSFPRFMELPPEVRLHVYEFLLVDPRERDIDGTIKRWNGAPSRVRFHPAVLRTSKQIYSEAQPVLYRHNKFRAAVMHTEEYGGSSGPIAGCVLRVTRLGCRNSFLEASTSRHVCLLGALFRDPVMDMLGSLTHLTIDLNLVTAGEDGSDVYVPKARNAISCLCLSLTGASKMKELTINVEVGHPHARSKVDFARILWPLVFLRTDIVVRFEGIAELVKTSMADLRKVPHAEGSYGRHIAQIRQRCSEEIEKYGLDVVGLRGIEAALASMNYFGDEFVRMDDIVNLSAAWTGMRSEADNFETMGLERASIL